VTIRITRVDHLLRNEPEDKDFKVEHWPAPESQNSNVSYLTDAEAREALFDLGERLKGPHAGRSIIEILWEELDTIVDRLHADGKPGELKALTGRQIAEQWQAYGEERGQAQGVAYALAVLINPYAPDIEAIRAESVERRKSRD
jgi:hypothetical protein